MDGTEIHHRLIEARGFPFGQQRLRQFGKQFFPLRGVDGRIYAEIPAEHPIDITIHHGDMASKSDAADGCRRIIPHALERLDFLHSTGEATP